MLSVGQKLRCLRKKKLSFNNTFLSKICIFYLQTTSLYSNFDETKCVLQVSGRNTFENAYKITSKNKFSTHFVQIPYHLHPALSNSLNIIFVCSIFDQICPVFGCGEVRIGQVPARYFEIRSYLCETDPYGHITRRSYAWQKSEYYVKFLAF